MDTNRLHKLIIAFIAAVGKTYTGATSADEPVQREIRRVLPLLNAVVKEHIGRAAPIIPAPVVPSGHPVVHYGNKALAHGPHAASLLGAAIGSIIAYVPWRYSYPRRSDGPDLDTRIAFAELVGPDAPFTSAAVCLGLTLIAPQTRYPEHRHPAIELYYVVSGNARWTSQNITTLRKPGDFVLHPSRAIHAMETAGEPLLAVYTWSGTDITTSSSYVTPE